MARSNSQLNGAKAALLIVDMINDFDYEGGKDLFKGALPAARNIARLKTRLDLPTVYVNDNFHEWHLTFDDLIERVKTNSPEGAKVISALDPGKDDYYILKPHQSGFFQTALSALLSDLGVTTVVITGVATDMCVLSTAIDAHLRELQIIVPADCTSSITRTHHRQTLDLLRRNYGADTRVSAELTLEGISNV